MGGCGLQPAPNVGRQSLALPGDGMDAEVTGQSRGHHLLMAVDVIVNLKAGGIQLLAGQMNEKNITAAHGSMVTGPAMDDGQRHVGIGEDVCRSDTEPVQRFFISLMAPAQQMVKMDDACRIGFPEAHRATDHEPWRIRNRVFCCHWGLGGVTPARQGLWLGGWEKPSCLVETDYLATDGVFQACRGLFNRLLGAMRLVFLVVGVAVAIRTSDFSRPCRYGCSGLKNL